MVFFKRPNKSDPAGRCFRRSEDDEQGENRSGNDRRDHDEGVALEIVTIIIIY